jgi:hypothetical protein
MSPAAKEALRHATLAFLAERAACAFPNSTITARIRAARLLDEMPDESDTAEALQFLAGLHLVSITPDALGSTKFYQATSAGVLAHERNTFPS